MSEIKNISLGIDSEAGLQDALQGVITQSFTLTDYEDGTDTPELTAGRTGEIGAALYRVEDGAFAVDVTDVDANGVYYIYLEDEGTTVTAYADDTAPIWNEEKGGWYNANAKAFFRFKWDGANYLYRQDLLQNRTLIESVDATPIDGNTTVAMSSDWAYKRSQDAAWVKRYTSTTALVKNSPVVGTWYIPTIGADTPMVALTAGTWEIEYSMPYIQSIDLNAYSQFRFYSAATVDDGVSIVTDSQTGVFRETPAGSEVTMLISHWVFCKFRYTSAGNVDMKLMLRVLRADGNAVINSLTFSGSTSPVLIRAQRIY